MTTSTTSPEIAAFAARVRAALADLPADDVDELVDGLEADLGESLAEDPRRALPDPEAYAAELRLAAGLPSAGSTRSGVLRELRVTLRRVIAAARENSTVAKGLDFLATLRPAWWLVRGWAAAYVIWMVVFGGWGYGAILPTGGLAWALMVACMAGSVWVGTSHPNRAARILIVAGNILAVVVTINAVSDDAQQPQRQDELRQEADMWQNEANYNLENGGRDLTGLYVDGKQVTNVFPYDAKGRPLSGVQLFASDGTPITTTVPDGSACYPQESTQCEQTGIWVPVDLETGIKAWNVFPLALRPAEFDDSGMPVPLPDGKVVERVRPFVKVPALK